MFGGSISALHKLGQFAARLGSCGSLALCMGREGRGRWSTGMCVLSVLCEC